MTQQQDKYRVLNKLDSGGMAEVFLAEAESLKGFKKRVAIKRVLPNLAQNEKFLAMFLDEARLSLSFNHGNVVQTFDIGRSGQTYFIVMEYVGGTNLKRMTEYLAQRNRTLPMELAIFIIIEVCRGLAYAHEFRDSEGNLMGIVHRDVSPPNILISKYGEVKIVDFGLAKATSQLENTDPGVVKGKFAYLSPEVASGKPVDHRADIFACGIILFELLTGQRLFLGDNDAHTVELVREAHVPSMREIDPIISPELETIVLKALSLTPEERYQSCAELAEALAGFLFEHCLKVTAFDLQRLVRYIAAEDETKQVRTPSIIDRLIQEEMVRFASMDAEGNFSENNQVQNMRGATPLDPSGFYGSSITGEYQKSEVMVESQSNAQGGADDSMIAPELARMLEGDLRLATAAATKEEEEKKNKTLLIAVLVLSLLLAGVLVAYFLGFVP